MTENGQKTTFVLNDVERQLDFRPDNLLEALLTVGEDVPYFCYHPGLKPAGLCRVCQVNLADPRTGQCHPKIVTACTTPFTPGMKVWTRTPAVQEARQRVLEFQLVNHPLDCPVCDKAGECLLQNHAYAHGRDASRLPPGYQKAVFPVRELGPTIRIWQTRCITCLRCVRFLNEVTGTGELCVAERGDRAIITTFPGRVLANPLAGNLVDLCPVGALLDKDFMYGARVWWLEQTPTVSPGSARGSPILIETVAQVVKRLRPQAQPRANHCWLPDEERYDYRYINDPARIGSARIDGRPVGLATACAAAREKIAAAGSRLGAVLSAWMTLEEIALFWRLFRQELGVAHIACLAKPKKDDQVFPGFTICGDKNPNRRGVELLGEGVAVGEVAGLVSAIREGAVKTLYVHNAIPTRGDYAFRFPPELLGVLDQLEALMVSDILENELTQRAAVVLPGVSFAEKAGTFVNREGQVQLLRPAIDLGLAPDLEVLQRLAGKTKEQLAPAVAIFAALAERTPALAGMSHWSLAVAGEPLRGDGSG